MKIKNPRLLFFYLFIPAIVVILVYTFIFDKLPSASKPPLTIDYSTLNVAFDKRDAVITSPSVQEPSGLSGESNCSVTLVDTLTHYRLFDHNPNETKFWSDKLDQSYQNVIADDHKPFPLKV